MGLFGLFKSKGSEEKRLYKVDPYEVIFLRSQLGTIWKEAHITGAFQELFPDYKFSQATYNNLINYGWIKPIIDQNSVSKPLLTDLKKICKEHGLTQTGSKEKIAERIYTNLSEDQLIAAGIPKTAGLSELGEQVLAANPHLDYIYNNIKYFMCNLYGLQKLKAKKPEMPIGELLINDLEVKDFSYPDYSWCNSEGGIKYADSEAKEIAEEHYNFAIKLIRADFNMN